jgi:serine/threonine protein kinase
MISGLNGYWTVSFYETCISNMDLVEDNSINSNQRFLFPSENKFLYIITELCAKTLKDVIIDLEINYCQEGKMFLNLEGFYIASQLFFELLEALRHLHKLRPPIIHRDLKPSNILITLGNNNRFLKIADVGLATYHEFEDQSHTRETGSPKYIAPEVYNTTKYNTKVDIYSLGVILSELFNFDINE